MDLYLRRVDHGPHGTENYRVIWKRGEGDELEIGSIGTQFRAGGQAHWIWAIDNPVTMREAEMRGQGRDRRDCTRLFRAAWELFASDQARLADFLAAKQRRR